MPGKVGNRAKPNDKEGISKWFDDFLSELTASGEREGYFAIQHGNEIYKSYGPTKWHEGVYDHRKEPK